MRVNYVLIDYENVQPKSIQALKDEHFHILVFVGANQTKLDIELSQALLDLAPRAKIIRISGNGRNALDFHIAYYIGKFSTEQPGSFFHIISNDTGFDPLIAHLKSQKIYGARSKTIEDMPIVKSAKSKTPQEKAALVIERLKSNPKARPATVKRLLTSINSWFQKELTEDQLDAILKSLVKQGALQADGTKVSYLLEDPHS